MSAISAYGCWSDDRECYVLLARCECARQESATVLLTAPLVERAYYDVIGVAGARMLREMEQHA